MQSLPRQPARVLHLPEPPGNPNPVNSILSKAAGPAIRRFRPWCGSTRRVRPLSAFSRWPLPAECHATGHAKPAPAETPAAAAPPVLPAGLPRRPCRSGRLSDSIRPARHSHAGSRPAQGFARNSRYSRNPPPDFHRGFPACPAGVTVHSWLAPVFLCNHHNSLD